MKVWIFLGFCIYIGRKWFGFGLKLGCGMDESVDFSGVLRYWVRYWDFELDVWKVGILVGLVGFLLLV